MQPSPAVDLEAVQETLSKLRSLQQQAEISEADRAEAKAWFEALDSSDRFLRNLEHPVIFIGEVGVGKSSLAAVAARLMLSEQVPSDRTKLKSQSLLAIGAGRTTVCEVRVRASTDGSESNVLGLQIEPLAADEMQRVIDLWAEDEWRRRQPGGRSADDAVSTPQEVARALRAMAGYAESVETYKDGEVTRRRTVQPMDAVVSRYASYSELSVHLSERIDLPVRIRTDWKWNEVSASTKAALKDKVEAINSGTEPSAALPLRMTLVLPSPLGDIAPDLGIDLSLVDTRGLEAGVGLFGRADLQEFVSDPRAILVLCAPFKAAPGDAIRSFLTAVKGDARWRGSLPRVLLVLLDHGDADQVNGAAGDRLYGQAIKVEECRTVLAGAGLSEISLTQIIAMDVLADPRERLVEPLGDRLRLLRKQMQEERSQQLSDAGEFLQRRGQSERAGLQARLDGEIKRVLSQHLRDGAPMKDPLAGLRDAIDHTRYASVVYASCRRKGRYRALDLYQAVGAEASRSMTTWLGPSVDAVLTHLDALQNNADFAGITDLVRLRHRQFSNGKVEAVSQYSEAVEAEVRQTLETDDGLWRACCDEWGLGGGFKHAVLTHFSEWAKRRTLVAHEQIGPVESAIPFWPEVVRPSRPPQFTLRVRHLRALRSVNWTPAPVSLLVGANGAGKTTTLLALRLMRQAYERGLPEAVRNVLGGSHNMRSWGAPDEEPVELGLQLGIAQWQVSLTPRDGSVDSAAEERLLDDGEVVFERNALGVLRYGDQLVKTDEGQTALRVLMDRGAIDPALRTVAAFLGKVSIYHEPDLASLRKQGSDASDDRALRPRAENVLAVLRRWSQDRSEQHRYEFVVAGMTAAFPNSFSSIDFQQVGNTLNARFYRRGSEQPSWIADEATGMLQMLVLLCCVAGTEDGGVVAIDEPENGLHPYAQRAFLRRARQWATQHHVTVLLATHSLVLLDEFSSQPEAVFVMKAAEEGEPTIPTALDRLCNPDWLAGFQFGDLYEQGEIGSNDDDDGA
jgi:predicted ATPase/GTPase SAR1 family protein